MDGEKARTDNMPKRKDWMGIFLVVLLGIIVFVSGRESV